MALPCDSLYSQKKEDSYIRPNPVPTYSCGLQAVSGLQDYYENIVNFWGPQFPLFAAELTLIVQDPIFRVCEGPHLLRNFTFPKCSFCPLCRLSLWKPPNLKKAKTKQNKTKQKNHDKTKHKSCFVCVYIGVKIHMVAKPDPGLTWGYLLAPLNPIYCVLLQK